MHRKTDSLIFKFGLIFLIFSMMIIAVSGYANYRHQYSEYQKECQKRIQQVSHYLASLLSADGEQFVTVRDYLIEHRKDLDIPVDFSTDYLDEEQEFEGIIARKYPGMVLGKDMSYEDLDQYGSELKVREAGKARVEGKDYLMQDGDICHFRFNV